MILSSWFIVEVPGNIGFLKKQSKITYPQEIITVLSPTNSLRTLREVRLGCTHYSTYRHQKYILLIPEGSLERDTCWSEYISNMFYSNVCCVRCITIESRRSLSESDSVPRRLAAAQLSGRGRSQLSSPDTRCSEEGCSAVW